LSLKNTKTTTTLPSLTGVSLGAAFLMANSSIGPGFLTQTSVYTEQLITSFGDRKSVV